MIGALFLLQHAFIKNKDDDDVDWRPGFVIFAFYGNTIIQMFYRSGNRQTKYTQCHRSKKALKGLFEYRLHIDLSVKIDL